MSANDRHLYVISTTAEACQDWRSLPACIRKGYAAVDGSREVGTFIYDRQSSHLV